MFTPSHYLSLFVSILIFLNPFYYRAGCDEQQYIYSRYKSVNRLGYGAMQLAGPGVFGPPRDRHVAITVLREALALGVNHIDTSDFYGPHVTNQIIREALYPYSDDLTNCH